MTNHNLRAFADAVHHTNIAVYLKQGVVGLAEKLEDFTFIKEGDKITLFDKEGKVRAEIGDMT